MFFSNVVFQALVNRSEVESGQKQVEYVSIGLGWDRTLSNKYKMYSLFCGCYSTNIFLRFVCQLPRVDPQSDSARYKVGYCVVLSVTPKYRYNIMYNV